MSPIISSHVCNDDLRQWRFERDSKLPLDTFKEHRISADGVVFVVCVLIAAGLILWSGVL